MARTDKKKLKTMTEVLRRGGRLLGRSCHKCGGVLMQYQGRTLCFNCDDIDGVEKISEVSPIEIADRLRSLASKKIEEAAKQLETETDIEKQTGLTNLLLKYIDMLDKISVAKLNKSKESEKSN